ncbi:zinc finger containing protein [Babesia caballi]|uniref:Zinc finger containing protein n=1 Tax=Babesia caballi TaxID=5871 RepID=A0AAV4M274_BABCB|nr:zinc finger containing protein [Babesia caballi]
MSGLGDAVTSDGVAAPGEPRYSYTVTSPISSEMQQTIMTAPVTGPMGSAMRADISGVSQLPAIYLPPIHYTYDPCSGKFIQMAKSPAAATATSMPTVSRVPSAPPVPPVTSVHSVPSVPPVPSVASVHSVPSVPSIPSVTAIPAAPVPPTNTLNKNVASTTAPLASPPAKNNAEESEPASKTTSSVNREGMSYTAQISQISRKVSAAMDARYAAQAAQAAQATQQTHYGLQPPTAQPPAYMVKPLLPSGYIYSAPLLPYGRGSHVSANACTTSPLPGQPGTFGAQHPFEYNSAGLGGTAHHVFDAHDASPSPAHLGTAQAFATSFLRTYDKAASVLRSFDDLSVNAVAESAQRMLHPKAANFVKAAVFTLRRLEGVPLATPSPSKVAYSFVVYFDPATENYNTYRSPPRWAVPSEHPNLVHCDLQGDVVKIPWQGEPYVYAKVVEHVNQMESVVGRLKLHIESLVRQHPLRVNIISESNCPSGNVILEFDVGHMSHHEMRDAQDEALRVAASRRQMDYQHQADRMQSYEECLQQHKQFKRDRAAGEYQAAPAPHRKRGQPQALGEVCSTLP